MTDIFFIKTRTWQEFKTYFASILETVSTLKEFSIAMFILKSSSLKTQELEENVVKQINIISNLLLINSEYQLSPYLS